MRNGRKKPAELWNQVQEQELDLDLMSRMRAQVDMSLATTAVEVLRGTVPMSREVAMNVVVLLRADYSLDGTQ